MHDPARRAKFTKPAVQKQREWYMRKPIITETVNVGLPFAGDEWFAERCPALFEGMARVAGEGGKIRLRHSVFMVHEDGCFRMCVRDRQENAEAWFSSVAFLDCLALVEAAVNSGEGPWRPIPGRQVAKGSSRKKT
jgi:hypothetical protein